jgi:hypothetical protein
VHTRWHSVLLGSRVHTSRLWCACNRPRDARARGPPRVHGHVGPGPDNSNNGKPTEADNESPNKTPKARCFRRCWWRHPVRRGAWDPLRGRRAGSRAIARATAIVLRRSVGRYGLLVGVGLVLVRVRLALGVLVLRVGWRSRGWRSVGRLALWSARIVISH